VSEAAARRRRGEAARVSPPAAVLTEVGTWRIDAVDLVAGHDWSILTTAGRKTTNPVHDHFVPGVAPKLTGASGSIRQPARWEVGARDGLQSLDAEIDPDHQLAMVQRLLDAGITEIEVTSSRIRAWFRA